MRTYSKDIFERGALFLNDPKIIERLDKGTQDALAAGQKEVVFMEYFIRKKISATSGIFDMMKDIDDKAPGVNNLDKGYIKKNTYFALLGVGIAYGTIAGGAATNLPASLRYSNAEYINTFPTALVNSEFTLMMGKKELMPAARTNNFLANAYAEYGTNGNEENFLVLPSPKLVEHSKKLGMQFEHPDTTIAYAAADGHYVEVRLIGVSLEDRNY